MMEALLAQALGGTDTQWHEYPVARTLLSVYHQKKSVHQILFSPKGGRQALSLVKEKGGVLILDTDRSVRATTEVSLPPMSGLDHYQDFSPFFGREKEIKNKPKGITP